MPHPIPAAPAGTVPESPPPAPVPDAPLTLRQEAFCRHYAAIGNAAGAAREAGFAAGSARQTGHDLLERSTIAERVRDIRAVWRAVEREEAQILLGRLEQAWDVAVEKGSAALMLRVIKLQAELSGLDRRHAHRRAGLWPLPGDGTGEEAGGPVAEAVRHGRHRTERTLALHRASRKALEERKDFDEADWLATAQRLHATVGDRRPRTPERPAGRPAPAMTNPDISLHPAADAPAPDSAPDGPDLAEHEISVHRSLHRAGLLPADRAQQADEDGIFEITASPFEPAWVDQTEEAARRAGVEGDDLARVGLEAYRQFVGKSTAFNRPRDPEPRSAG